MPRLRPSWMTLSRMAAARGSLSAARRMERSVFIVSIVSVWSMAMEL